MQFAATGTLLPLAAALEVGADKGQLSAGNPAVKEKGLRAALDWRDARFKEDE